MIIKSKKSRILLIIASLTIFLTLLIFVPHQIEKNKIKNYLHQGKLLTNQTYEKLIFIDTNQSKKERISALINSQEAIKELIHKTETQKTPKSCIDFKVTNMNLYKQILKLSQISINIETSNDEKEKESERKKLKKLNDEYQKWKTKSNEEYNHILEKYNILSF